MTSKERVIQQLNFKKTDRVPFNFWMDRRLMSDYENRFGEDFRVSHYDADVIETFPLLNWPAGKGEERDGSFWFIEPVLKDWGEADKLKMPDPKNEKVYGNILSNLNKYPDKAIFVNIFGPFTILHGIRLMDNLFLDVYDYPDELHSLIKRIMNVYNKVIEEVVKLPITAVYFQDDIASSDGLMFSSSMIEEFLFDYFKEGIQMAQRAGKYLVFHSDGKVTDILDTLVKLGFNAVNPLQPEFNDFNDFKSKYHGKLGVYGGIDNTKIIPDGSLKDIEDHISNIFNVLGNSGGLIMSSHDIPIHCPHENVEAMVKYIKSCTY
jgi:uroporphyrinogen-III decarboxylase